MHALVERRMVHRAVRPIEVRVVEDWEEDDRRSEPPRAALRHPFVDLEDAGARPEEERNSDRGEDDGRERGVAELAAQLRTSGVFALHEAVPEALAPPDPEDREGHARRQQVAA